MAKLNFKPVFREIMYNNGNKPFSAMYFGRCCSKNVIILKNDFTIMLVFGDAIEWSKPELIKSATTRGESGEGIQIVGCETVILMLDNCGTLWKLINTFDISDEESECLHCLADECFYEWVPFKKFNFAKVLAVCAMEQGFACIGLNKKFEKKLAILPSLNSSVEEFTFDGLISTGSLSYYLTHLIFNTKNFSLKNNLHLTQETLLITDQLEGKTCLYSKGGKSHLISKSNISLISALQYHEQNCVVLCYENGKLVFYFYTALDKHSVVHLPRKLIAVEKFSCCEFCLLWSDGIDLFHTNFTFDSSETVALVSNIKLLGTVQSPSSFLRTDQGILMVTINNIFYVTTSEAIHGVPMLKDCNECLNEIKENSLNMQKFEEKIEMLSHYLYCKDIMKNCNVEEKVKMYWEGNSLIIRSLLGICLKCEFWKVRLKLQDRNRNIAHIVNLEYNLNSGMSIKIENPFKSRAKVRVSLIGNFDEQDLFVDLGEVGESDEEKNQLSKCLNNILKIRNADNV